MTHRVAGPVLLSALLAAGAAAADDKLSGTVGKVAFENSCSPQVQETLLRGVATLHSFFYSATEKAFEEVAAQDSNCVIAAWGFASILMSNPLAGTGASAKDAPRAQAAIDKGRKMQAKTERERDYLEAVAAYYEDFANRPERERQLARAKAYEALAAKYPKDDEAQIFYALYLAGTQLQSDQTYAAYLKAAAILEKQFVKYPEHPGVAHYLIHSYDAPPIAQQGVPAARRYAQIAPDAPHAQHMPSHIFTRLGLWQESIDSNLIGHRIAAEYAQKNYGPGGYDQETVHTLDYLAYAYLQTAQDGAAKGVVDEVAALRKGPPANLPIAYALAAIPARYALERRDWAEAAALAPVGAEIPWERFPWAAAMTHFTRALGAAHTGDLAAAKSELAMLQTFKDRLLEAKNEYWANQVEVQRLGAAAVLAEAEGDGTRALDLSREAAELEQSMDKHPATPGAVLPARELRGDLLLERKDAAAALQEYEASLRTDPNRFRSVLGTARAARLAGDGAKAKEVYQQLIALCANADTERPELVEAKGFVTE